ncbi:MAG TPA: zf-HC2 domain-containing protein [Pyrinomonadaceae bacterium]
MKSDSNTEMDLLLRRHARRKGSASPGAAELSVDGKYETSEGPHMDADEMNAYAEGALPEAARARYFAHLADCDRCRAIVTDLTLAANLPVRDEERAPQQATTPQSTWREWLAALFAPPMIRYGAMAAALLCVVGIVFLALRQQRSSDRQDGPTYVAQNREGAQQPASAVKTDSAQPSVANVSPGVVGTANNQAETKDTATTKETRPPADIETDGAASKAKGPPPPVEETKTEAQAAAASADAGGAAPVASARPAPKPVANEPRNNEVMADRDSPAAPPAPVTASPGALAGRTQEITEADRLAQNRKDGGARDERGAGSATTSNTTSNTTATRESEETIRLSRRARASETRQRSMDKVRPEGEGADTSTAGRAGARAAETRNAGGRQFRREGSAWVDTAYSSGRATVNIKRGSEQYRALVADEPGIGTIADQLGGEVIIVWKSRAYRIR